MRNKPIIVVAGEPYSIFFEIFFKSLKKKSIRSIGNPIILVASKNLLIKQMNALKYKFILNEITFEKMQKVKLDNRKINIINVNFNHYKTFDKITSNSSSYIEECCDIAIKLVDKMSSKVLINGPISKKHFLRKNFPGMSEYFARKVGKSNKEVMLIFNKKISVSPITTHFPLRKIFTKITTKKIVQNINTISLFYKKYLNKSPKFAVTGLNPHCESSDKISEEHKIITPAIKKLKEKKIKVFGPYPADTIFLKNNFKQFDIVVGMYHDQVLAPIKSIYGFDAINITLGLPFLRLTPDHGPNESMLGKNISNPESLIRALEFAKKIK